MICSDIYSQLIRWEWSWKKEEETDRVCSVIEEGIVSWIAPHKQDPSLVISVWTVQEQEQALQSARNHCQFSATNDYPTQEREEVQQ